MNSNTRIFIVFEIVIVSLLFALEFGFTAGCFYFATWGIYLAIKNEEQE